MTPLILDRRQMLQEVEREEAHVANGGDWQEDAEDAVPMANAAMPKSPAVPKTPKPPKAPHPGRGQPCKPGWSVKQTGCVKKVKPVPKPKGTGLAKPPAAAPKPPAPADAGKAKGAMEAAVRAATGTKVPAPAKSATSPAPASVAAAPKPVAPAPKPAEKEPEAKSPPPKPQAPAQPSVKPPSGSIKGAKETAKANDASRVARAGGQRHHHDAAAEAHDEARKAHEGHARAAKAAGNEAGAKAHAAVAAKHKEKGKAHEAEGEAAGKRAKAEKEAQAKAKTKKGIADDKGGNTQTRTSAAGKTASSDAVKTSQQKHEEARSQLSEDDQKELDHYAKLAGFSNEELHEGVNTKEKAQKAVLSLSRVVAEGTIPPIPSSRFKKFVPSPPPPSTHETPAGWKPSMSADEAKDWAKGSAIEEPLMHVTSKEGAEGISKEGFDLSRKQFGKVWGEGVYATGDEDTAKIYSDQMASGGTVLHLHVKVQKPLRIKLSGKDSFYDEAAAHLPGGVSGFNQEVERANSEHQDIKNEAGRLYPTDAGKQMQHVIDKGGDKYAEAVALQRMAEKAGHDAFIIEEAAGATKGAGGNQVVVFNPKNVVVSKENK